MASEPVVSLPEDLAAALRELAAALDRRALPYVLIGGLAAGFRGQPRFTLDIDLLLHVPQVVLPGLLEDLRGRGFEANPDVIIPQWTQEHMAVLRFRRVRVDWLRPVLPCFQHVLDTASVEPLLGTSVRIASAEGLILTKLLAFRDQDLLDIQNLLAANPGRLDLDWIRRELETVYDAADPHFRRLEELVAEYYQT